MEEFKDIVLLNGKLTREIKLTYNESEEMFVRAKELRVSMMRLL